MTLLSASYWYTLHISYSERIAAAVGTRGGNRPSDCRGVSNFQTRPLPPLIHETSSKFHVPSFLCNNAPRAYFTDFPHDSIHATQDRSYSNIQITDTNIFARKIILLLMYITQSRSHLILYLTCYLHITLHTDVIMDSGSARFFKSYRSFFF